MTETIKSGQEILNEFFSEISDIEGIDKEVALIIQSLYQEEKLSNTNISNALSKFRESKSK